MKTRREQLIQMIDAQWPLEEILAFLSRLRVEAIKEADWRTYNELFVLEAKMFNFETGRFERSAEVLKRRLSE